MSALDLRSGKIKGKAAVGQEPEGVTLRPDGKVVYVTSESDNAVFAIDTKKLTVLGHIATGPRPRGVAFTQDGTTAFVAPLGNAVIPDLAAHRPGRRPHRLSPRRPHAPRPDPVITARAPDVHRRRRL